MGLLSSADDILHEWVIAVLAHLNFLLANLQILHPCALIFEVDHDIDMASWLCETCSQLSILLDHQTTHCALPPMYMGPLEHQVHSQVEIGRPFCYFSQYFNF